MAPNCLKFNMKELKEFLQLKRNIQNSEYLADAFKMAARFLMDVIGFEELGLVVKKEQKGIDYSFYNYDKSGFKQSSTLPKSIQPWNQAPELLKKANEPVTLLRIKKNSKSEPIWLCCCNGETSLQAAGMLAGKISEKKPELEIIKEIMVETSTLLYSLFPEPRRSDPDKVIPFGKNGEADPRTPFIERTINMITEKLNPNATAVGILDNTEEMLIVRQKWSRGLEGFPDELKFVPSKGITGRVLSELKTVIIEDISKIRKEDPQAYILAPFTGVLSSIAAPVKRGRRLYGVLVVDSARRSAFDEKSREYITEAAEELGMHLARIENQERQRRTEEQRKSFDHLHEIMSSVALQLSELASTQGIFDEISGKLANVIPCDGCGAFSLSNDGSTVEIVAHHNLPIQSFHRFRNRLARSPIGDVIREGKTYLEANAQGPRSMPVFTNLLNWLEFKSCIIVPILRAENMPLALMAIHEQPNKYSDIHLGELLQVAGLLTVMEPLRRFEDTVRRIAPSLNYALLSAGAHHEVKNALHVMNPALFGFNELLEKSPEEIINILKIEDQFQKYKNWAADALNQEEQINRWISNLVGYLKVCGEQRVELRLFELIEQAMSAVRFQAENRRVNLDIDGDDSITIVTEPVRLRQVLVNLLLNAIYAASIGPNKDNAKVKCLFFLLENDVDEEIIIEINDNGPGISKGLKTKIFRPGFTTRKEGGTGLGLWICRLFVDELRGHLDFESIINKETTFIIKLPLNLDDDFSLSSGRGGGHIDEYG